MICVGRGEGGAFPGGRKWESLRKARILAEKLFLYDKYRSGGMTREQFVARTGSIGVRVEEIGKVEDRIERMEGCGSQEGGGLRWKGSQLFGSLIKRCCGRGIEWIRVFGEGQIEVVGKYRCES